MKKVDLKWVPTTPVEKTIWSTSNRKELEKALAVFETKKQSAISTGNAFREKAKPVFIGPGGCVYMITAWQTVSHTKKIVRLTLRVLCGKKRDCWEPNNLLKQHDVEITGHVDTILKENGYQPCCGLRYVIQYRGLYLCRMDEKPVFTRKLSNALSWSDYREALQNAFFSWEFMTDASIQPVTRIPGRGIFLVERLTSN